VVGHNAVEMLMRRAGPGCVACPVSSDHTRSTRRRTPPTWSTATSSADAIFEYLEIFHNRQRQHSSLGMLSPVEYERLHPTLSVA
jgi:transposase InsO family protein